MDQLGGIHGREQHSLALEIEAVVLIVFKVPAADDVQVEVLAEFRGPRRDHVGLDVVGVIGPAGLVRGFLGHIFGRFSGSGIESERSTVPFPPATDGAIAELPADLEDVLDEIERQAERRVEDQVRIILTGIALDEGRIGRLVRRQGIGPVVVVRDEDRLAVLVDLVTDKGSGREHRLGLDAAENGGVVVQAEPVVDLDLAFSAQREGIVGLLTHLIDTVLPVITPRYAVGELLTGTADADIMGLGAICRGCSRSDPPGERRTHCKADRRHVRRQLPGRRRGRSFRTWIHPAY